MSDYMQEPWPHFVDICEPATPNPDSDGVVRLGFDDYLRAMVCVNACEGISTDRLEKAKKLELESEAFPVWIAYCEKKTQLEDVTEQRDELLVALELLLKAFTCGGMTASEVGMAHHQSVMAIAKGKRGQHAQSHT